jgi:hypothetical protein
MNLPQTDSFEPVKPVEDRLVDIHLNAATDWEEVVYLRELTRKLANIVKEPIDGLKLM